MFGYRHVHDPAGTDKVPRKIDPADRTVLVQEVAVKEGRTYILSARLMTREREGGWQRNNRLRLLASSPGVEKRHATQWYATGDRWQRVRLRFTAGGSTAVVGVELYRWWALVEDAVFVDDVWLTEAGVNRSAGSGLRE